MTETGKPLVSIIIPSYNKEKYFRETMTSMVALSYEPIEIIVVEDGSPDGSTEVLREFAKKYPQVRAYEQENHGQCHARNRGIDLARGEYLMFVDCDDTMPVNAVDLMVEAIMKQDADICCGRFMADYESGKKVVSEPLEEVCYEGLDPLKLLLKDFYPFHHVWATMFKKAFVDDVRFNEAAIVHDDNHFLFELFIKKPKVQMLSQIIYHYRVYDTSYSRGSFNDAKANAIVDFADIEEKVLRERFPELHDLTENWMIKADLAVLANMPRKEIQDRCIPDVIRRRKYFIPESTFDKAIFFLVTHHLYWLYGIAYKVRFRNRH